MSGKETPVEVELPAQEKLDASLSAVAEVAKLIATYHKGLTNAGMSEELIGTLTKDFAAPIHAKMREGMGF